MKRTDAAEVAAMLRRLVAAVDDGYLTAGTPRALALVRHIEGAAVAFELIARGSRRASRLSEPDS